MPTEMENVMICQQNICLGGVTIVKPPAPHSRNGPAHGRCLLNPAGGAIFHRHPDKEQHPMS